jgi:choline-sulfatase
MRSRHGLWLRADGVWRMVWPFAIAISLQPLAMTMACTSTGPPKPAAANLLLITVDTLRADRLGAYGYARARTPTLDALAKAGTTFERAYSASPVTLPSHATLLTGRYPPGHGSRDNGMRMSADTPTLATTLQPRGLKTAAFVAAFPLDHQFGLNRGFDVYGDRIPRGPDGRIANERPASQVVDDAIAWLRQVAGRAQPPVPSPQPPAPARGAQ